MLFLHFDHQHCPKRMGREEEGEGGKWGGGGMESTNLHFWIVCLLELDTMLSNN